jgi:hypothetical protein
MIICRKDAKAQRKAPGTQREKSLRSLWRAWMRESGRLCGEEYYF